MQNLFIKRVLMTVLGVVIAGISVGMFSFSEMGVDPFQVFAHGTKNLFPLSFGTYYVILNLLLLVVSFVFDRRKIGLGTLINLFLTGYLAEYSEKLIRYLVTGDALWIRIVFLLVGIVIMCFASAFYFTADMGVSTYDAVALILSEKRGWKFRYVRIATDLVCVVAGGLLGGVIGVGTVVTAFFMGPLISFFSERAAIPFLHGKEGAGREKEDKEGVLG